MVGNLPRNLALVVKCHYAAPVNKKTPTSSPLGKSQKLSSIVQKREKNSPDEINLLETGRDLDWSYSKYKDGKLGHCFVNGCTGLQTSMSILQN